MQHRDGSFTAPSVDGVLTASLKGQDVLNSRANVDHTQIVEAGNLRGINEDVDVVHEMRLVGGCGLEGAVLLVHELHGAQDQVLSCRSLN